MNIQKCPSCGAQLEEGYINAPSAGVLWLKQNIKYFSIFSKKVEKLQKDWWSFSKLTKDNLPALRCANCKIAIFQYNKEC